MFENFQMRMWYDKENIEENVVDIIYIRCSNCGKTTVSYVKSSNIDYKDIITKFVLNTVLHHVGMSCIIETNQQSEYDIDKHNPYWITDGPWYKTSICTKLHETVFEKCIRNTITDRYNHMCSIDSHEKQHP